MANSNYRPGWPLIAAAAVILALLVVGIRSAGVAAGAESATASKVASVKIVNFAFKPATLTIARGSSVTFSNSSTTTHTATRDGTFDSGRIKPGKSVTVRFKQRGSFPYRCMIHPSMRGKIVVD